MAKADVDHDTRQDDKASAIELRPRRWHRPASIPGAGKDGVVVADVDPDGMPRRRRACRVGDVILEAAGQPGLAPSDVTTGDQRTPRRTAARPSASREERRQGVRLRGACRPTPATRFGTLASERVDVLDRVKTPSRHWSSCRSGFWSERALPKVRLRRSLPEACAASAPQTVRDFKVRAAGRALPGLPFSDEVAAICRSCVS